MWWYQIELLGKESDTIISSTDSFIYIYMSENLDIDRLVPLQ